MGEVSRGQGGQAVGDRLDLLEPREGRPSSSGAGLGQGRPCNTRSTRVPLGPPRTITMIASASRISTPPLPTISSCGRGGSTRHDGWGTRAVTPACLCGLPRAGARRRRRRAARRAGQGRGGGLAPAAFCPRSAAQRTRRILGSMESGKMTQSVKKSMAAVPALGGVDGAPSVRAPKHSSVPRGPAAGVRSSTGGAGGPAGPAGPRAHRCGPRARRARRATAR